jgi:hypothetical protein
MKMSKEFKDALNDNQALWRVEYTIVLNGHDLYWLLWLAEVGIYAKEKFRSLWGRNVKMSEKVAYLSAWRVMIAKVAKQVSERVKVNNSPSPVV